MTPGQEVDDQRVIEATERWVRDVVVNLNLCPFAKRELVRNRVRFVVSAATTEDALLESLHQELQWLNDHDEVETTLLVHPHVLWDFLDYNEFLPAADDLLRYLDLEGIYQVASLHPDYQFGGTEPGDVENYTNRSPYPMLHLLREESLERAIDNYPDVDEIPQRNIERMAYVGLTHMQALLKSCFVKR